MQPIIKKILLLLIIGFTSLSLHSQITLTPGDGYYITQPAGVVSIIVKKEGVTDAGLITALTAAEQLQAQQYTDGFGRSLQDIVAAGSPAGKDLISIKRYDAFGRQATQYLPYEANTTTGVYLDINTAVNAQSGFYTTNTTANKIPNDISPFSSSIFEQSPLQRVLKVGGVGDGFQPTQHYKTVSYRQNTAAGDAVRKWDAVLGTSAVVFADNDLSVTEGTDEAGTINRVFSDKYGRLILKKQQATVSTWYDTYYLYDNAGNISYIIPPKAVAKMIAASSYNITVAPELLYSFGYDYKNRVISKKAPGTKFATIFVYDPLDRLVLMQDANLQSSGVGNRWMYFKYDISGRLVIEGLYAHGSAVSQAAMQTYVNGQACYAISSTTYFEGKNFKKSTPDPGYVTQCFPMVNVEPLAYHYYDNYQFSFFENYTQQLQGLPGEADATANTIGLPTGTKKKIMGSGTPGTWITEAVFYDKYYHVIQVRKSNQLTAIAGSTGTSAEVKDNTTSVVDFAGKTLQVQQVTWWSATQSITAATRYGYDNMGRLQKLWQTNLTDINADPPLYTEVLVAQYEYNALGKLVDKKLHSTNSGSTFLQSVDYRYNIRGQLTSINNSRRNSDAGVTNDDANDLFGMELLYDKADAASNPIGNTVNFTGLISGTKWSSSLTAGSNNTGERSYIYSYDKLYRLTTAAYKASANVTGGAFTKDAGGYDENLSYDENGNILTLSRWAMLGTGTFVKTQIDNLTYTYKNTDKDNKLDNIADAITPITTGYGFRNIMSSATAYNYDDNGNLVADAKKGTTLSYNELNKLSLVVKTTTQKIEYRYNAAGVRISKYVYNGSSTVPAKKTEYIGGYVFENGNLAYYAMAEGRVRNDGGASLTLKMEYFVTDHQGNVRISFEDNGSGTAVLKQETSYYAFGMQMAQGYTALASPNRNLYNAGSEWQDEAGLDGLGEYYSTFYREYDAVIGRFNGVDPMSESFESWSTFQYSYNNPVNFNDPMGDKANQTDKPPSIKDIIDILMNSNYGGAWSSSAGGGGGFTFFTSGAEALGWGIGYMNSINGWGSHPGWANSQMEATSRYIANTTGHGEQGYNYINAAFSGAYARNSYRGDEEYDSYTNETYYYAGYGDIFDFAAMEAGYAIQQRSATDQALDAVHGTLDLVSVIPGANIIASGINSAIYLAQGEYGNAALSAAAMIPFEKVAALGLKYAGAGLIGMAAKFQRHHLIPNQIFRENEAALKAMGWIQNHSKNLMELPVPFHGKHPSYNEFMRQEVGNILQNGGGLSDMINLQNKMRGDVQTILNSGVDKLNNYYKALGY